MAQPFDCPDCGTPVIPKNSKQVRCRTCQDSFTQQSKAKHNLAQFPDFIPCKDCSSPIGRKKGRRPERCPDCYVVYRRLVRQVWPHNITIEQLRAMGELCHICGSEGSYIDHDHRCCLGINNGGGRSCGQCVRGLLCPRCNNVLGLVDDSVDLLEKMINYIRLTGKLAPSP